MTDFDAGDALAVLTQIKLYHQPQDNSDAVAVAWARALSGAGVTNVNDAMAAVDRHYSTPGANRWIIPGDVIRHYRELRYERIADIQDGELTPDLDPHASGREYARTTQARAAAMMDGVPKEQAIATIPPVKAIEARK